MRRERKCEERQKFGLSFSDIRFFFSPRIDFFFAGSRIFSAIQDYYVDYVIIRLKRVFTFSHVFIFFYAIMFHVFSGHLCISLPFEQNF